VRQGILYVERRKHPWQILTAVVIDDLQLVKELKTMDREDGRSGCFLDRQYGHAPGVAIATTALSQQLRTLGETLCIM